MKSRLSFGDCDFGRKVVATLEQWFKKQDPQQESEPSELAKIPKVLWVRSEDNPWGVPVLDLRPFTLGALSTTTGNLQYAMNLRSNLRSFVDNDGTEFIGVAPAVPTVTSAGLRYRVDKMLADGVLFTPREMEHKWAIYFHRGQIIFVRSWLRKVLVVADIKTDAPEVEITRLHGTFGAEDEPPSLTVRITDYLLRSHALDLAYPAPLPSGMEEHPQKAAVWCFSQFGNRALYATPHELPVSTPDQPLRTSSLLHIAVARGNVSAAQAQIDAGVPVDLLGSDGLAPLHWPLAQKGATMRLFLLERGSPLDVRSAQGATPLMNAVQDRNLEEVTWFLNHGADPNAKDLRGFTALHRAAQMGELQITQTLLRAGASPHSEAQGFTARALAEKRGHEAIANMLDRA